MDVGDKHAGYTHAALRVTSVEAAVAMLNEAGISITGGPNQYPRRGAGDYAGGSRNSVNAPPPIS